MVIACLTLAKDVPGDGRYEQQTCNHQKLFDLIGSSSGSFFVGKESPLISQNQAIRQSKQREGDADQSEAARRIIHMIPSRGDEPIGK